MNELTILKSTIEIRIEKPFKFLHITDTHLSFDGERNIEVRTGDRILIQRAEETTKLLKLVQH